LLLFNWCGFQMLNAYLEKRATLKLQLQLDENKYDEASLISVKVPAARLSYYNYSEIFEKAEGQIEIHGVQYNFVKRRLFNDSIEMLCIANPEAMHFKKAGYDFFKLTYDLQRPGGKKTGSHTFKRFTSVYCTIDDLYHADHLIFRQKTTAAEFTAALPANKSYVDERPPKQIA
jgi:hypothetical protein